MSVEVDYDKNAIVSKKKIICLLDIWRTDLGIPMEELNNACRVGRFISLFSIFTPRYERKYMIYSLLGA